MELSPPRPSPAWGRDLWLLMCWLKMKIKKALSSSRMRWMSMMMTIMNGWSHKYLMVMLDTSEITKGTLSPLESTTCGTDLCL